MNWKPMIDLPYECCSNKKMFVVKGIDIPMKSGSKYTTDPYCVWVTSGGKLARWPHEFEPTHFCLLPEGGE